MVAIQNFTGIIQNLETSQNTTQKIPHNGVINIYKTPVVFSTSERKNLLQRFYKIHGTYSGFRCKLKNNNF